MEVTPREHTPLQRGHSVGSTAGGGLGSPFTPLSFPFHPAHPNPLPSHGEQEREAGPHHGLSQLPGQRTKLPEEQGSDR